jgi:hypothetical protein
VGMADPNRFTTTSRETKRSEADPRARPERSDGAYLWYAPSEHRAHVVAAS